jgi:predicted methyltransferase
VKYLIAMMLSLAMLPAQAALDWEAALAGDHRSAANKARDGFRHPAETLQFFGLREGMTVVEISPGGGWYTEILAPLLLSKGTLYTAHYGLNGPDAYYRNSLGKFLQKVAAAPAIYDSIIITQLQPPKYVTIAPAGSADMVVAFRNVHSWMGSDSAPATLAAIYTALKPGGVFGVVQHRALPGTSVKAMKKTGYVTQEQVLKMMSVAGFELVAKSDINSNPKDTADHPEGVWTLPPALELGDKDREKYLAIGESDRMTMKFVKPR